MPPLDAAELARLVAQALQEDLGPHGDITTDALIPAEVSARAHLVARAPLVVAGLDAARCVFEQLDRSLRFVAHVRDGDEVARGTRLATVSGPARPILRGERTALNFLMRLCGIATAARAAVREVAGTRASVLDTRKTIPGWRRLDKYAAAVGGARNHRMGLYDGVLIKDTHLALCDGIEDALSRAQRAGFPAQSVILEVRDLDELERAVRHGAGHILLDNFGLEELRRAVALARGRARLEASGGLRPGTLRAVAETGVDQLSVGWLTHSAPAADVALEMERPDGAGRD